MKETSKIIHSIPVDELTGAISVPIYQTSTFVQDAPGVNKGYDYARTNNPTRKVLENLAATLEEGHTGVAFASGLAAIDAVIKLLKSGDEIIAVDDIYGGAFRQFTHVYQKFGIHVRYVNTGNVLNIVNEINPNTKMLWIETPTNPTLKISDLNEIGKIAEAHGLIFCVDNTFASPVLQKPILFGADIVIHSATKYLGGHSDLISGLVVTKSEELGEKIRFIQNATGAILSPFDSWLVIRGIETLHLRVEKHSKNALKIARFLKSVDGISNVYYPGLTEHENHNVASMQMSAFGGVLSFDFVDDDKEKALQFIQSCRLFKLAESLGGIKSLCCLPSEMTHKSIPRERRLASGVADSLVRLSVGLEDSDDLIEDISIALAQENKIKINI